MRDECKGCGLCIEACPPKVIRLSEALNHYGYRTAVYAGAGCTGCGICFMVCPEPGAITVLRLASRAAAQQSAELGRAAHAQATDEGQRSHRQERDSGRMPRVLWLSHYAGQRDRRSCGAVHAARRAACFVQAESEVAAINMLYGGASAGVRAMTASSGPGISLMQEGISYMAGAELPCVIADITRGGPGLGNIGAEQGDYHQVVKGGGHGNYRTLVLAPHSVQEMADLTALAFELADRYRNPVVVHGRWIHRPDDGAGRVSADSAVEPQLPEWAVAGTAESRAQPDLLAAISIPTSWKPIFASSKPSTSVAEQREARAEEWRTDDAEIVLVGYGIVGAHSESRGRRGAGRRPEGGRAAAHHAVSVSQCAIPAAGGRRARLRGGRDEQRADARRCAAGAERRAACRVLQPHGRQRAVARGSAGALCASWRGKRSRRRSWKRRGSPCLTERNAEYEVAHGKATGLLRALRAQEKSCSTRRITVPAAGTASCTRCWRRPSTSWAFRTAPS